MHAVGRNDPCPCGSGRKHKRCCLDIDRAAMQVGAEAEKRVLELGELAREQAWPQWRDAYERHLSPLNRHGLLLPEMAAWLDTWLVCDAPVIDGRTPLEAFSGDDGRLVDEQLRRSAISGWWLRGSASPIPATHWRRDEPVTLHTGSAPLGALGCGALLIARGIATSAGHVALVGRPVVVDEEAMGDVLAVLNAAPSEALCAALRWPEARTHTAEGDLVEQCFRRYALDDPEAAIALLRAAPACREADLLGFHEDDVAFHVYGPPLTSVRDPAPVRGVRWELCEEDREDPPQLGEVTVSPEDGELALSAPTSARADRLLAALPMALHCSLGSLAREDLDVPDVLPRVNRERLEGLALAR